MYKRQDIELEKEGELKGQALARSYGRYENVFLTDTELSEMCIRDSVRTEYRLLSNDLKKLSYHIGRRTGAEREQLLSEYNEKRKLMLKMPCTAQTKKCRCV